MATRKKSARKSKSKSKPARKKVKGTKVKRKAAPKRKAAARRAPAKRAARKASPPKMETREGMVTHTEFASADPAATQAWCERTLGWRFMPPMETPTGPYRMWQGPGNTGGGIRANNPPEPTGVVPYVEVKDIHATFAKALAAGGSEVLAPMALDAGMGSIAVVMIPGGAAVGFWSAR